MLALYRAGRQAEALDAYRQARTLLVEQIGVEPGAELRQPPAKRSWPRTRRSSSPRPRPSRRRRPRVRPRAASRPVLAIAALLLFAGIVAFGISRVLQPDSLSGIREDHVGLIDADGRITDAVPRRARPAGRGRRRWLGVGRQPTGRNGLADRPRRGDRDDRCRGRADGARVRRRVAVGRGRPGPDGRPGRPRYEQGRRQDDVGNAAHAVAVGSGAVWVASAVDATVVKIDLVSGRTTKPIPVEARPSALAAGAGAIWVASEATARVIRLDPRSGTPLDTIAVGNGPSGVAVGAGAVWVANRLDGTVSRIDPATDRVTEPVPVGREPRAVAADEDGVWVANAGDGTVMRIDPREPRRDQAPSRSRAAPPRWPWSMGPCGPPRSRPLPRTAAAPCA